MENLWIRCATYRPAKQGLSGEWRQTNTIVIRFPIRFAVFQSELTWHSGWLKILCRVGGDNLEFIYIATREEGDEQGP